MKKTKNLESKLPKIGNDIYVPTSLHLYRGKDDFLGGLCKIVKIEEDYLTMVGVEERPGVMYNWEYLKENQKEWKKEYRKRRGTPDPDYRPEFNEGWS
ncbi:MAG: hypothetical protein KKA79_02075 [Nanoarchaeota archaeon]|nr:hypothetical protein [Nanoarchaeota archaeon]MCG2717378.1 hypothetical protein [Nanoarchaeota archaeon]